MYEELQYQKSRDFKSQKLGEGDIDEKSYKDLIKRKPELANYSKGQTTDKANQFTFRSLFSFLNKRDFEITDNNLNYKEWYGAYLHNAALYSDLSSFVHGGPESERFIFRISMLPDEKDQEILLTVENLMVMHFVSNLIILSFLSELDEKYKPRLEKIMEFQADYYRKIKL